MTTSQTISGRELAEAAFRDVESFVLPSEEFRIYRDLDVPNLLEAATFKSQGVDKWIRLSRDFCAKEMATQAEYCFSLFVVCHEIAHYLNQHNRHRDRDREDSVALEARADNYGAQLLLAIMTFGSHTNANLSASGFDITHRGRVDALGRALGDLYRQLFLQRHHRNYPNPDHRIFSIASGMVAFFYRFNGSITEEWVASFLYPLLKAGRLFTADVDAAMAPAEQITERIFEVHRSLQETSPNLAWRPDLAPILNSNFRTTPDQRRAHQEKLETMVNDLAFVKAGPHKPS